MPADDVFELNIDMTISGQNVVNVHHFIQSGVDGTGTWQDALLSVWQDNFKTPLRNCMVQAVTIVQTRMRRLQPTQTQQTIVLDGAIGDILSPALPPHLAVLLRQRAFPTGRKGTGGVKIVGIPDTGVADGRLNEAYKNLVATYGDVSEADITDGATGYTFRAGVLSQVDNVFRAIEKSQVTPRVVTVHSRQIGVGQ